MKIDNISSAMIPKEIGPKELGMNDIGGNENLGEKSFKHMLTNSINEVNDLLQAADKASVDVATGKSENLHESMVAFEKAETAMKFLVQVRNKAIDAYHEIMRMQV